MTELRIAANEEKLAFSSLNHNPDHVPGEEPTGRADVYGDRYEYDLTICGEFVARPELVEIQRRLPRPRRPPLSRAVPMPIDAETTAEPAAARSTPRAPGALSLYVPGAISRAEVKP